MKSQWPSLRDTSPPVRFWADAICMNQADAQERSSQVQLMYNIFSQAKMVISWLGADGTGDLEIAFALLNLIANELSTDPHRPTNLD